MMRVMVICKVGYNNQIFCRTNQDCDNLEKFFIQEGNGQKLEFFLYLCYDGSPQHPNMGGYYSCVVLAGLRDSYSRDFALDVSLCIFCLFRPSRMVQHVY